MYDFWHPDYHPVEMSDTQGIPHHTLGTLTRRPFVSVAIVFGAGILLHEPIAISTAIGVPVLIALLVLATVCRHRRWVCNGVLAAAILLAGVLCARVDHFAYPADEVGLFATDDPHLTELELRLPDAPQLLAVTAGGRELPPKQVAIADVLRIKTWQGWTAATGRIAVQIDQPNPALDAGQTVQALGMLQRPRPASNPGEFDWAVFYREQRILSTLTITRGTNCKIVADPGPSPLAWLRSRARRLMSAGFMQSHSVDAALLQSLFFGDHDAQLRDLQDQFKQTGVRYQLSVSGIHMLFLAWPLVLLGRWLRLRPRWVLFGTTAFILLYAAVSMPSHSGVRAVIACVVVGTAYVCGRDVDRGQLLSLGALAMLLWHPMDLYSVGFHISFAVVIVCVLILTRWREWSWLHRNPDEAALRRQKTGTRRFVLRAKAVFYQFLQYSVLSWVAGLPLVAYHIGTLAPWAIPGEIFILPFVLLALQAGAAKIVCTLLWPVGAAWWADAAAVPARQLQGAVFQLTKLPGGTVKLATPPVWLVVVYYALLIIPLLPRRPAFEGRRGWLLWLAPVLGIAAILFLPLPPTTLPARDTTELRLTVLSLGAGQCIVVEPPGGRAVIFDAGSSTVTDVGRKIIEPFLQTENQHRVSDIFLSHGDFDHVSAAAELAEFYDAGHVMTSYHFRKNAEGNLPDQVLLDDLEKQNLGPQMISTGDHFDLGSRAAADCLWPPQDGELNSNNAGLVMRLTYAGRSVLLPADIQDPAFIGLLKHPEFLKSDVLIAPHHGSSEELTPAFLAAVRPDEIISSNAWRLTNKQKRFDAMVGKTPLYRTSECGAITVTISAEGKIAISTFKKLNAAKIQLSSK